MRSPRDNLVVAAGALVAVLAQVMLAPSIAVFGAQPNVLLAYVLVVSIARPDQAGPVLAFVLGLLYDLLGTGPVGAMALLLVLASWAASRVFEVLDNDAAAMPLLVLLVSAFAVEALYGALLISQGLSVGLQAAFVYRVLPCALYDAVVGLLLYPLMARLLAPADADALGAAAR